ncbi:hypothetical protein FSP39_005744, partial [Pinctada imbricata]
QVCINTSRSVLTDEQRLLYKLMRDYDPNTRPVYNASHPVNVYIGFSLTQIFDVDEKNQVLTTNVWFDQEWKDEKLVWDPQEYNNLTVLRIPCKNIWLPDIVLYNSAEDYTNGYMEALAMVSNDGTVFWPPIVKFRSTCEIDITYYPFDDQICKMKMGSWAYDGFQVDVFNRSNGVDLTNFVSNGEWQLIKVDSVRNVVRYPCCTTTFPDVTFFLHIRRRTLYYTYNVIIPCVMLSMLTLLGFWMRPDSGEKVTLGLTVLLAFSVFMLLIAENMPATSNFVPLIGIYLTTIMSMTSFSVIMAVMTSNINVRGCKEVDLPRWLERTIIFLAKINCMRLAYVRDDFTHDSVEHEFQLKPMQNRHYAHLTNTVSSDSGCPLMECENGDVLHRAEFVSRNSQNHTNSQNTSPEVSWESQEILRRLQVLVEKEEEKEKSDILTKRWMEASEVIDRCLFWLFCSGTTIATVLLLVVIPLVRPYNNLTEL